MHRTVILLSLICALAAEAHSVRAVVLREVPATTNTPAHVLLANNAVSLQVFTGAGGGVAGSTNLCEVLPIAPTNECVAWKRMIGRTGVRTLWLGRADGGGERIVGLSLEHDSAPLRVEVLKPGGAAPLVREAYRLRLLGKDDQNLRAKASKTLRLAARQEPLDVWNAIERAFLEDDGEDAAAKAALYNSAPVPRLLAAIQGYAELGAWGDIRELARQSVALAAENPAFAHPRLERLAKMNEAEIRQEYDNKPSNNQPSKP